MIVIIVVHADADVEAVVDYLIYIMNLRLL